MKPAPFDYRSPDTLAEAMALLASHAGEAKLLAGGQSLMPVLNFRLATPSLLVDLGRVPDLDGIAIGEDGVRIGAMVRWRAIERDPRLAAAHPLLKEAVSHVAHYQIRNRGTAGGSLAHADPAAELPGIAVACDGEIAIVGPKGARTVKAADFFIGPLATVLAEDEIITALALPPWPKERRWAFLEFARRRGDFAMAGIALFYDRDGGHARNAHVGVIGAASRPHRLGKAEARINGSTLDDAAILAAARAAAAEVDPPEDFHASAAYRRNLVEVLTERALRRAGA